ncbi:MAG: DUF3256 family protein [Prevotellaceae bacterium]|jgi:hypothetical protein|nr:DUF3256 family protein [Prevotellaceae bacterium]
MIQKIVFSILTLLLSGNSTFLSAQEAKTLFTNMPDSLCPLLTAVNRADCIDFRLSNMKAEVTNRFDSKSEMTALTASYIRLQLTAQNSWQLKVLPTTDSTAVVCIITTACAPACDSDIRFYTTDWKPLQTAAYLELPTLGDYLIHADSLRLRGRTEANYPLVDAVAKADMLLQQADFAPEGTQLTFTFTTPGYMSQEAAEALAPYVQQTIVYRWNRQQERMEKMPAASAAGQR